VHESFAETQARKDAATAEREGASARRAAAARATAETERQHEAVAAAADLIKEAISGAFSSAADAVAEFVRTGKVNFASLISSMLADLARLAVQQAVLAPQAKLLGGLLSGSGGIGSIIASIFHDGGAVGGRAHLPVLLRRRSWRYALRHQP